MYKAVITSVITAVAALAVSYFVSPFFTHPLRLWFLATALLIFLISFCIEISTMRKTKEIVLYCLGYAILVNSAYWQTDIKVISLSVLASFLGLLFGAIAGQKYAENSIRVRFAPFSRRIISQMLTGLVVSFVLVSIPTVDTTTPFISQEQFTKVLSGSSVFFSWFGHAQSVDDFLASKFQYLVKAQLSANPKFQILPDSVKDQLVQKALEQSLKSQGETEITPAAFQRVFAKTLYTFIVATLTRWKESFGEVFPLFWGVLIFLIIRSTLWIYQLAVGVISFALFELLLAFGFVKIGTTSVTKEIVEF